MNTLKLASPSVSLVLFCSGFLLPHSFFFCYHFLVSRMMWRTSRGKRWGRQGGGASYLVIFDSDCASVLELKMFLLSFHGNVNVMSHFFLFEDTFQWSTLPTPFFRHSNSPLFTKASQNNLAVHESPTLGNPGIRSTSTAAQIKDCAINLEKKLCPSLNIFKMFYLHVCASAWDG